MLNLWYLVYDILLTSSNYEIKANFKNQNERSHSYNNLPQFSIKNPESASSINVVKEFNMSQRRS